MQTLIRTPACNRTRERNFKIATNPTAERKEIEIGSANI
jgi:hypothetical protein